MKSAEILSLKEPFQADLLMDSASACWQSCLAEAICAVSTYCDLDFLSPPRTHLLRVLEAAFEQIRSERPEFSPEDYTVYAFSILLDCCVSDQEVSDIRKGAQAYMRYASSRLSADIASLIPGRVADLQITELPPSPVNNKSPIFSRATKPPIQDKTRERRLRMEHDITRSTIRRKFKKKLLFISLALASVIGLGYLPF